MKMASLVGNEIRMRIGGELSVLYQCFHYNHSVPTVCCLSVLIWFSMKTFHRPFYLKRKLHLGPCPFSSWTEQGRVTDLVGKLIHASTRISYPKILGEISLKVKIRTVFTIS
jgi:hypothetical protein